MSQINDDTICVRRAPLEPFQTDLNNAPDLFPAVSVLAAFCDGESHIYGAGRLVAKESNRAEAIVNSLRQMGVQAVLDRDVLVVTGENYASRIAGGRCIKGGEYRSFSDHRMVMALKVAALGADGPIEIDDEECVSKSFPDFSL